MQNAIDKLNEYRDWVLDHEEECYWTNEEKIQDAIDILESNLRVHEYCEKQL